MVMVLALGIAFVIAAETPTPRRPRRRSGRGLRSGRLLSLVANEQVQKELKLKEEQIAKVKKVNEKLTAEIRKEYTELRKIEDRAKRRAKYTELAKKFDGKAREELGKVLAREQMIRLYQIRMQFRAVTDSLASRYVAGKLKLTDEQKKKVADIAKDSRAKRYEIYGSMRNADEKKRAEARKKLQKIREDADKKALEVLTADQNKAFQAMKGKKFELKTQQDEKKTT